MHAFAKIGLVAAVAAALLPCQRSDAFSILLTIRAPRDCPEGLTIKSKVVASGMTRFDVSVDAEEIAQAGELYKGRVGSHAVLRIGTAEQPIASLTVLGTTEGKRTRYQFDISPSAAKTSELQLGVSLFEKDGFQTIGGGTSMQIHLAGFEPTGQAAKSKVRQ